MISEMLKLENIQIIESAKDWKEALHLSLDPLVNGGDVTENYEAAIIKCTEEYGPYYVLADDIALIHGRPEDGVLEKQLSITVVRQPIQFMNDGQNVRVLIALGASDANSHIDVMKVLSLLLMDESKIKELAEATSEQQIYEMLTKAESNL